MYWKDTGLSMSKNLSHGFTLLEILLAVTIFTMMSLTIYHAAIVVVKGSATVTTRVKKINEIQQVIKMLEFDISHATIYPRVFLNNNNKSIFFQVGSGVLESDDFGIYFLLSNIPKLNNGFDYHSASIGYRLKNKILEKLSYTKLGCIADQEYQVLHVIDGVIAFRIRLYHEKKWLTEWQHNLALPHAVEVTIELEDIGIVRRTIILLNSGVLSL